MHKHQFKSEHRLSAFRWTFLTTLVLLTFLGPEILRGQNYTVDYSLQIGSPAFTTALPVENGFINVANGNLHLSIPIDSSPQRGKVGFGAALVYDSRIWNIVVGTSYTWQPTNVPNSQGGWRYLDQGATGSVVPTNTQTFTRGNPPVCSYMVISDFLWTAPDGTQRMFPISTIQENPGDSGCPDRPTANGFANDASGFKMFITDYIQATIYAPDGTQVFPSAEDTNGNVFSKDGNGNVIDTLGRTPVTYVPNGANCSTSYCYNVVNSHGTTSQIKVTTTTVSVNTAFGVAGVTEYSGNLTVIQKITLPDQTFYQFGYDSYGEINSVTLPTGGVITYGYTNYQDSFGSRNRWVTSRSSGGGNWSYTPAVITTCGSGQVGCQQKVTVVAPSTNQTVYTFTLNNGAWKSQLQSYTGSTTLLSTTSQAWDFSQACTPTPCTGASNIRVLTTTTTLPTPGGNNVTNQTKVTYNDTNTMNIASIMTWKFYAGTSPTFPTIPDHETDFTYHALIGNNILNLVSQTTGKDSAGNVAAQTNFLYDSEVSGSLANSNPSTGISQHDDANYGLTNTARGNLTAINRCTNLSSCTSNYVQTVMTYDTTGQVLSVKDPNGNTRNLELRLRR